MKRMLMSILTIGMIVESAHDHGSTGGTTGSGCKCMSEESAISGKRIDRRCLGNWITIAAQGGGLIIGDEENNIFLSRKRAYGKEQEEKNTIDFHNLENGKAQN